MAHTATDRLLLQRRSVSEWRAVAQTTHAAQYQRLLRQARSHHKELPPAEHPSDSITYIGTAVMNMALAFLLSDDEAHFDTARRWIKAAIAYPSWGKERMPDHDLDAAWLLFGLGLGYDWLKDDLPQDERAALRDKLAWHARELRRYAVDTEGRWWSSAYWQNHNWICYGGLATAAYALMDEVDAAAGWAERARDNFAQALALMPEDGSNYEGPVYWRYGFIWFLIYADLLKQQTGEDLHDSQHLRNTFFYRLYLCAPNLVDTANFGDGHDRRSAHPAAVYARLASLYGIGEAQWLYHHFYCNGEWQREGEEGLVKPGLWAESGLEFLWYDPAAPESPINRLPLQRVFPDLGLLSMRSSWDADATLLAFKCGAPNGMKAWHSGHAINRAHDWQTLNPGHDHPDANSFILIKGSDYIAVDDGYAKSKLTAQHSALLIDGQGQFAEGAYNAFRGLDETWGARLEAHFDCGDLAYARGEAARAYDPQLDMQDVSREILFLSDHAVIFLDTLRSDTDHDYEWLLQTDSPAVPRDDGSFAIEAGQTTAHLHPLQPQGVVHRLSQREITANPTSAKPDWIIRRTQHTLTLSPPRSCPWVQFFTVLEHAGMTVEAIRASRGVAAQLGDGEATWRVGMAIGRDGIQTPGMNIDGRAFAGQWQDGQLRGFMAVDCTALWLNGEPQLIADRPLDIHCQKHDDHLRVNVTARAETWLRIKSQQPAEATGNGKPQDYHYDKLSGMVWLQAPPGKTDIIVRQDIGRGK